MQSTPNFLLYSALRVFSRRCYRAINLLKNGPTFLPLWCCLIMRKDKLLVRVVDWLVIPYNVSLIPLISPWVQQLISSVFFFLPGTASQYLHRGLSPPLLLPLRKSPADQKKQRLSKVQKRQILQSSSFKETVVQMKYRGLWLIAATVSIPHHQSQRLGRTGLCHHWMEIYRLLLPGSALSASSSHVSPLFTSDLILQHSDNSRNSFLEEV